MPYLPRPGSAGTAAALSASRRGGWVATLLQRAAPLLLALVLVGTGAYFHFVYNFTAGRLTPDAMDMVQSARHWGPRTGPVTYVVRPLLLGYTPARPDGSLHDAAHAPLYPSLAGVAMRLAHHRGLGVGDKVSALLSLLFLATSGAACWLLARRLFGGNAVALHAAILFTLCANAPTLGLTPHPATLAATLFTLLLLALSYLDNRSAEADGGAYGIGAVGGSIAAGIFYGLLFQAAYSTLALLPVLLAYIWLVTGRRLRAPALFLLTATLCALPSLYYYYRASGNPFFNTRLLELIMQTQSYPGYTLYRSANLPETVPQFIATGGWAELLRKMGGNLLGFYAQAPAIFGVLLLPLFAGAALIRFSSGRVNRLRTLVYACLFCHAAALSLFVSAVEAASLFLMYLPIAAIIGAAFVRVLVRARNLPSFFARSLVFGWTVAACVPGLMQFFARSAPTDTVWEVFYRLNTNSAETFHIREKANSVLCSEVPWEVAFRMDLPTVWLPNTSGDFLSTESALGKPISGIILTPTLEDTYGGDMGAIHWWVSYKRVTALIQVTANLDRRSRDDLLKKAALFYPQEINDVLRVFQPVPYPESNGARFTLLYWNPRLVPVSR